MGLKEQMAVDAALVFLNTADFGESATYTPAGSTAFPVTVGFKRGPSLLDGNLIETEAVCLLLKSEVASPTSGDIVTLSSGDVWQIDTDALRAADENCWQVSVRKNPVPTFRR